ncbi:methyltransferase [soil metagenome]
MSESVFHFLNFTIRQDRCAMKVGTDGVLLGAWVKASAADSVLDIGTGTGLIALMICQKSNAHVDAIDIDEEACLQAKENVLESPWPDRVRVIHSSLQEFKPGRRYDLIVTNPPYFIDSFAPTDEARNRARQASASLSYEELLSGVIRLLAPSGKFFVILPAKEGQWFRELAEQDGLFCNHITSLHTKADKPEKRVLMEFSRKEEEIVEDRLIIHNDEGSFTEAYKKLTGDYYPRFNAFR